MQQGNHPSLRRYCHPKYSDEFKEQCVIEYRKGFSPGDVSKRFGVPVVKITAWVNKYKGKELCVNSQS